jgi:thiol:disulfide interchange protein
VRRPRCGTQGIRPTRVYRDMRRKHRIGLVAALWALVALSLTVVAGVGFAKSSASAGQYQYGKKVTICHKGKVTIRISRSALPAHMAHKDTLGPCSAKEKAKAKAKAQAKEAKKAQAKVKAKAEKAKKAEAKVEAKADKAEAKVEAKAEKSKGKSEKKVEKAEAKADKAEAKADKAEAKAEADQSHESDPGRSGEDHGKGQGGEQPNDNKGKKK